VRLPRWFYRARFWLRKRLGRIPPYVPPREVPILFCGGPADGKTLGVWEAVDRVSIPVQRAPSNPFDLMAPIAFDEITYTVDHAARIAWLADSTTDPVPESREELP
jgi:hypothetical protein